MAVESPNLVPTFSGISWNEPKTDWTSENKFNKEDYNRIKNNLTYLQNIYHELKQSYSVRDLGNDVTSYTEKWKASSFNSFEEVLEVLNIFDLKIGTIKTFVSNDLFIDYVELNRIESACVELYELMCNEYIGRRTLPAVLGFAYQDTFMDM